MRLIGDSEVAQLVTMREAIFAMTAAFEQFGNGAGAIAPRVRATTQHNQRETAVWAASAALPAAGVIDWLRVVELGKLLVHGTKYERKPNDIVIYNSVGVGLADVALAQLVWRRAQ